MSESEYRFIPSPYPPRPDCRQVVVDPTLTIPGYAADAKVTGDMLRTKVDLAAITGKSLEILTENCPTQPYSVELSGFNSATINYVAAKGASGKLEWIKTLTEEEIQHIERWLEALNEKVLILDGKVFKLREDLASNVTYLLNEDQKIRDSLEQLRQEVSGEINSLKTRVTAVESAISGLDTRLKEVEEFIKGMDDKFKEIFERLTALEASYAALVKDIEAVNERINQLELKLANKLDKSEFNTYKETIGQTIGDILTDINTLQVTKADKEDLEKVQADVSSIKITLHHHEKRLDDLERLTDDHETRIENLENGAVRYDTPQTLTEQEKKIARENIGVDWSPEEVEERIKALEIAVGEFDEYIAKQLDITNVLGDPEMYKPAGSTEVIPISKHLANIYDSIVFLDGGTEFTTWNRQKVGSTFSINAAVEGSYDNITILNVAVIFDDSVLKLDSVDWLVTDAVTEFDIDSKSGSAKWVSGKTVSGNILKLNFTASKKGFTSVLFAYTAKINEADPGQSKSLISDNIRVL